MNFRIAQKQLIVANITLFVISIAILEYSKLFRMSIDRHWIYSYGHIWWFMVGIPFVLWGSLFLGIYSLIKVKKDKFLYFIFSLIPLILFIFFISI